MIENKWSFDEIENQIEVINIRQGSFSKDRKMMLNSLFKYIIDYFLPNSAKHLMYAAEVSDLLKEEKKAEKTKKLTKYQMNEFLENENLEYVI